MDVSRWQRLEAIFHATADLPAGPDRDAQLEVLCGSDEALLVDVRALLVEDRRLEK